MPSRGLMKAAPDYATTSFSYTVNSMGSSLERMLNTTEKIPTTILADIPSQSTWANMQTWSTQAAVPAGTSTTPSIDNPRDCCGQVERETDLAQSFVLYFAPVVIGLAIVMCIARLLFNYCTFRALTQPESSHCSSTSHMQSTRNRRHAHHIHTLDHNRIYTIPCERNDSLAQIFMQVPPPNYEQAQKYGRPVASVAQPIDQGPPPYAYQNPLCLNNEQSDPQQRYFQRTYMCT
ncbi:unnamed protein product [Anisakis simplex]|uniref:Protein tweety homolog n=1 Tax=Anisakis simplex TaxID=6269 RepID=A0A0M3K420_ANISI|nr:unnamed protein product [Anisakis simplex]